MEASQILTHEIKEDMFDADHSDQQGRSSSLSDESSSNLDDMSAQYYGPGDDYFRDNEEGDSTNDRNNFEEMTAEVNYAPDALEDSRLAKSQYIYSSQLGTPLHRKECPQVQNPKQQSYFKEDIDRVPTLNTKESSVIADPMQSPRALIQTSRIFSLVNFRKIAKIGLVENKNFVKTNVILRKPIAEQEKPQAQLETSPRLNERPSNYRFNISPRDFDTIPLNMNYIYQNTINQRCQVSANVGNADVMPYALVSRSPAIKPEYSGCWRDEIYMSY